MRKINAAIAIMGLGALSAFVLPASLSAMPLPHLSMDQRSDTIQVSDHHDRRHSHHNHHGNDDYYNRYDDSGVLFKSFVTGTLFRHDTPRAYYSDNHVKACAARYRSYDAGDNTYQPVHGARRQCR